ncbi:type II secretion system F family protein [Streptomyces sp. NPDC055078]
MTGDLVHRLGTPVLVAATVIWLASGALGRRRERRVRRRAEILLARERSRRRWRPEPRVWIRRWAAPFGAVVTGYVLVGGVLGCAVGLAAAYGVWRRQRRGGPGRTDAGTSTALAVDGDTGTGTEADADGDGERQLPLAADLLAACISAGAGPREAAEAVGESLGGPVGERLTRAAAELRLGGEPDRAWGWFAAIPGAAELARCLKRADSTGAPAAEPVARLAERLRADRARSAVARGRRAQVLITAPVGLCFLPAFLAVGVAPVVIGLAGGLLNGD